MIIPEEYKDCEYLLISALLYAPKYWSKSAEVIKPEYFYNEDNRKIWNTMVDLKNFDSRMIIKKLDGEVSFKTIMGLEGLSISRIITEAEVKKLCWLVVECYKRTEINKLKSDISGSNLKEITDKISQISRIGEIEEKSDTIEEYYKKIDRLCRNEKDLRIFPCGFSGIDDKIEGFKKSELIILGGRPAMGKTTLAMNMAFNIARKRKNVLFFSLEMGAIELHEKLITSITEIKPYLGLDNASAQRLLETSEKVRKELPLQIDDRASLTVEDIYLEAKKAKDIGKLDMIIIDHLSILKSEKQFKSRYEEISDVSRQLKVIAKEFDVPVLCLCQLNRAVEGKEIKAPTMADLRDSGSIEQDADLVMFVYRPEYYIRQQEPENVNSQEHYNWEDKLNKVKGIANVVIAKNRRGETGSIPLIFNGNISKFTDA